MKTITTIFIGFASVVIYVILITRKSWVHNRYQRSYEFVCFFAFVGHLLYIMSLSIYSPLSHRRQCSDLDTDGMRIVCIWLFAIGTSISTITTLFLWSCYAPEMKDNK